VPTVLTVASVDRILPVPSVFAWTAAYLWLSSRTVFLIALPYGTPLLPIIAGHGDLIATGHGVRGLFSRCSLLLAVFRNYAGRRHHRIQDCLAATRSVGSLLAFWTGSRKPDAVAASRTYDAGLTRNSPPYRRGSVITNVLSAVSTTTIDLTPHIIRRQHTVIIADNAGIRVLFYVYVCSVGILHRGAAIACCILLYVL